MIAVVDIARICHEANRALQVALNDPAIPVCQEWDHEDQGIRDSAVNGVVFHLGSDVTPRESHENWMRQKEAEGWVYGEKKDLDLKTHPCFVPYDELSPQDRIKDELFSSIVRVFKEASNAAPEHVTDGTSCWCDPQVVQVPPVTCEFEHPHPEHPCGTKGY